MTRAIVLYGGGSRTHKSHTEGGAQKRAHTNLRKRCTCVRGDTAQRYGRTHSRHPHRWDSERRRNLRTQTLPLGHMPSEQRETLLSLSLVTVRSVTDRQKSSWERKHILAMSWRNPKSLVLPWNAQLQRFFFLVFECFDLTGEGWIFLPWNRCCKSGWLCQRADYQRGTVGVIYVPGGRCSGGAQPHDWQQKWRRSKFQAADLTWSKLALGEGHKATPTGD